MKFLKFFRTKMLWLLLLPYALSFVGVSLNQAVLIANHDTFPVQMNEVNLLKIKDSDTNLPVGMIDEVHVVMTCYTHLNVLADIFDLGDGLYSAGDLLIKAGEKAEICPFIWIALMLYREDQKEKRK